MKQNLLLTLTAVLLAALVAVAANPPPLPKPTLADVAYGPHPKQVLHFWKAESSTPTPLLYYIHGGGWERGDRSFVNGWAQAMLKAGISVVSVEYRFIAEATADKLLPPVKGPLLDAARGLQFVRSKATEWNIDKQRIAATGNSAGACSALWLAFHSDLADPSSADPVARESTRLCCATAGAPQTTLDPKQMREWIPNCAYGGHAFGFKSFAEFLANRDKILAWINEYSPYALVRADAPPVYLAYGTPPALGQAQKDYAHTSNFGVKLQEKCRSVGVVCELSYPGASNLQHRSEASFVLDNLTAKTAH